MIMNAMLGKMQTCASRGEIREALIIGQNLFNQMSGDQDVFSAYYSVLWSLVSQAENIEVKEGYFQQLSAVLATFSETTQLNDATVEYIKSKEDALSLLLKEIQQERVAQNNAFKRQKVKQNCECLEKAEKIIGKIKEVKKQREFDALLRQLQEYDAKIDKSCFAKNQKSKYEALTQCCTQIVNGKMRYFEHEKNVEYNLKAIEAYEKVFKFFKANENSNNHQEIIQGLFAFDATRLYNETLTYYNHVYSYVLSRLNDDEKFIMTKLAIYSQVER